MGCFKLSSLLVGVWAICFGLLPYLSDVGQCDRVCKIEHCAGMFKCGPRVVYGEWKRFTDRESCGCFEELPGGGTNTLGDVKRLYEPVEHGYPYIYKEGSTVCGEDGVEYGSKAEAEKRNMKVVNCGKCGKCSNVHDVRRLRELGDKLVQSVAPCMVSYMLSFTNQLDRMCMRQRVGFTDKCADCWVEDHGCLFAHCFYECVLKVDTWMKLFNRNRSWDNQEGCMGCMESKCSKPYIDSCGANRRTSGSRPANFDRDEREICSLVDI